MMKGLFIFILILLVTCISGNASYSAQYWAKTYGGTSEEYLYSTQQTSDGGYIVGGYTFSFAVGKSDAWVIKLDSSGTVTWQKTFGGIDFETISSVQQTTDEGYVVAGGTSSFGAGNWDAWVIKLNSSGDVIWQKTYGGSFRDQINSIQQTTDEGYVGVGQTDFFGDFSSDAWIIKLDSNGNVLWQKRYGGSEIDQMQSIQQTTGGGYVVTGITSSFGAGSSGDAWIIKLDNNGNVLWQKRYGGNDWDSISSIQQTTDGGYVVTGITYSFGAGSSDAWIIKLDNSGGILWAKTYGGPSYDYSYFIQKDIGGGYIVAGATESFGAGERDAWVIKLNSSGDVIWQKTYGESNPDTANFIHDDEDGYTIAGYTASFGAGNGDAWVLNLDSNGEIPNCNIIRTSNVTITDLDITSQDTNAIISDTLVTPDAITIPPADSSVRITTVCGDNAIPTLSEWGMIIFMTLILGISVVMLYKRRGI